MDENGEEEETAWEWAIVNPTDNWNYADSAPIPTNGTKPSNSSEGKLELRAVNAQGNPSVVSTHFIGQGGQHQWSHTFEPSTQPSNLWPTMGKKIGEECGYNLRLYKKTGNNPVTYAWVDPEINGAITRTQ
jgi:hypothetical protein